MIQGKTKIQLFDSNGKLENEIVEKNMVTNALKYLVSPDVGLLCTHSINSLITDSMPFYSNALGGIMLFDENIEENTETIFKPNGIGIVGYAGSEYAGSYSSRGTYNSNESGKIENGYRHVWDFGTDKANGTIKCLSLTSKSAGDNLLTTGSKEYCRTYYNTSILSAIGRYVGQIEKNTFAYVSYQKIGDITGFWLKHIQVSPKTSISIFTATSSNEVLLKQINITTSLTNNAEALYSLAPDESGYAYMCKVETTGIVKYSRFSIITGEVNEGSITLNMPEDYTISSTYCIMWKNCVVVNVKNASGKYCVAFFDDSGNLINLETSLDDANAPYKYAETDENRLCISNQYYIKRSIENYRRVRNENVSTGHGYAWGGSQYRYKNAIYNITAKTEGGAADSYVTRRDDYLATINNLQSPVVKTNAQTMKITYDITEV